MRTSSFEDSFVLHVELVCPGDAAADRVLHGLERCAGATRAAGPGVPLYVFHRSNVVTERARGAVQHAVGLEYFELYLDAEAFWRHAESAEFLAGFAEVTNPKDRLERSVYVAGRAPTAVTRSDVWVRLRAEPLELLRPLLFSAKRSPMPGRAEYVSLHVQGERSAIEAPLLAIADDASWVVLLVFRDPASNDAFRLMGVRAPTPVAEQRADWLALFAASRRFRGTAIVSSTAPLTDLLAHDPGREIHVMNRHYAGYTLHPDAGSYGQGGKLQQRNEGEV